MDFIYDQFGHGSNYYVPSAGPSTWGERILEQSGLVKVGSACPARNTDFHFYIHQLLSITFY